MAKRRVNSDNSIHTFVNKCSISRILRLQIRTGRVQRGGKEKQWK